MKFLNVPISLSFVVAYCSMNYELLLAQTLALVFGHSLVHFTLTIGLYLFFLGMGSLLFSRRKALARWEDFLGLELLLSSIGLALPLVIIAGDSLSRQLGQWLGCDSSWLAGGYMYSWVALIGLLSGGEIPLLVALASQEQDERAGERVVAADYGGSFAAALLFPSLVFQGAGLFAGSALTALVSLLAACSLMLCRPSPRRFWYAAFTGLLVLGCLVILVFEREIRDYGSECYLSGCYLR